MNATYKLNKDEAMNKCIGLGEKFINCFHNIYMSKDNDNKKKWLGEMHHYFNEASNIVLDGKNRPLLLMDCFSPRVAIIKP